MHLKISPKIQILLLSSIGVYRTIKEFYNKNLEDVWQLNLSDVLSPYQSIIASVISGIILVREFTGHLYIASYFLILFPIIMRKFRRVLLLWMIISGIRSILLNLGVAITGIVLCSCREELNYPCFQFVAEEALELGCSIYLWTVVNDYYHSLKKMTNRSHYQSPFSSPNISLIAEETSSSFLSDEWSLPSSLVEEFQKSTKENLIDVKTRSTVDSLKNLKSKSVDSLLAQAMVDWFIKKIVKFKPKTENGLSPQKLSTMTSSDVNTLRQRIKKSIADIDEDDIREFLNSEDTLNSKEMMSGKMLVRDPEMGSKGEEIISQLQGSDFKEDTLSHIEGSKRNRNAFINLVNDANEDQEIVTNCNSESQSNSDKFSRKFSSKLPLEPMNAVNLVVQLFEGVVKNASDKKKISENIQKLSSSVNLSDNKPSITFQDDVLNEENLSFHDRLSNDSPASGSLFDLNEKALDCSIVIVKSILENVINSVTHNVQTSTEEYENDKSNSTYNTFRSSTERCEIDKILKTPLKESNAETLPRKRISSKKILISNDGLQTLTKVKEDKTPPFGFCFESNVKHFHEFPEKVKNISFERISKKGDNFFKTIKPCNKENEYDTTNHKSKYDKLTNESEMTIKALRYHFRRSNQSKVPIKRSKDTALSQKSLKSIIEGIKLKDMRSIKSRDIASGSGANQSQQHIFKKSHLNLKNLHKAKETSAQTITTRILLDKIKEAEDENEEEIETFIINK